MEKKKSAQVSPPAPPAQAKTSPPESPRIPSFPARLEPQTDAEKKLDANLLRVVRAEQSGGAEQGRATAKSLSLLGADDRIKVEITLQDKSNVAAFRGVLASSGGQVVTDLENHVFAMIPPDTVSKLASRREVFAIAVPAATIHQ